MTRAGSTRRTPLRHDDQPHTLPITYAEYLTGFHLAAVDVLGARADDFTDIGAGDQAERENTERLEEESKSTRPSRAKLSDEKDGDNGRQAAENIRIDADRDAQSGRAGNAHDDEYRADDETKHRRGRRSACS